MKKVMEVAVVLAAVVLGGCSGGSSKSGSMDVALPVWTVPAGQEMLKCVYQSLHNDHDLYVDRFDTIQVPGGHHILGFLSTTTLPDGTEVDCSSPQSMESWRPLLTGLDKTGFKLPDHYAIRIPANSTIVWQSHYVNATTSPIDTSDQVKVYFTHKDANLVEVQTYSNTKLGFNIAPGTIGTDGVDCVAPEDMHVFTMFGHMHEWGKAIKVELGPNAASMTPIYEVQSWSAQFRDSPPKQIFPFTQTLDIHAGDHIHLSCTWDNTQGADALTFPKEMCATVFWFFPGSEPLICSD